jgi:glucosamine-6-phosphate deaminase
MDINIYQTKDEVGESAAKLAAQSIRQGIIRHGEINIILATGASQFEMLSHLVEEDIPWMKVNVFHLDEYAGMPESHPASFRRYLRERFVSKVKGLGHFYPVNGDSPDPVEECRRLAEVIRGRRISLACIGIGENGHIAFNDPPADFDTEEPYIVVNLDDACRKQQLGEGWFPSLNDVPTQAISMSIRQIMKSDQIICTVPDLRKAEAVRGTVENPVNNRLPATILQKHPACTLVLDQFSASLLK